MKESEKQITARLFQQREQGDKHSPYEHEFNYYEQVREGNTTRLSELINELGGKGMGILSKDPIRNVRYHFIISVALVTRYCVEGGLEMETAYTMSDYYINKADEINSISEINALNMEMAMDFATKMKAVKTKTIYSRHAVMCMDYVTTNLHSKLTVESIAENIGLSAGYLSRMFHKETGVTVSGYVVEKRIEAAQNLLKYSDYKSVDIANYLCFGSHSHFISVFRKYTGMTPKQYRNKYFRSDWTLSEHRAIR